LREVAGERPVAGEEFASLMRNMTMRLPGRFETLSSLEGAALDLRQLRLSRRLGRRGRRSCDPTTSCGW
jgi:zinc protease